MKKIFISIALFIATGVCGYFTYYYLVKNQPVLSIVFLSAALIALAFGVFFLFLFFNRNNQEKIKSLQTRLKLWTNISYHVTGAGDEVFNNLPVGILVYDDSNDIKWANDYTKKIFNNSLVDSSLEVISKDLLSDVVHGKERMIFKYGDASYDVIHNAKNDILYFFDVTQREEIIKRYNARITAVGIVGIDNLEESLKRFDVQEKTNLRGQILGEISDWVGNYNCYLQSVSNDRMVIVMDRESLDKMSMYLKRINHVGNNKTLDVVVPLDDFDDFDDAGEKEDSKTSDTAASERSYVSLTPEKKEAPAETPEETSEHSEESEKVPADADVSSEEPVKTETVHADAPVSEDGEAASEKEDSDAAPDDSTTVTVEEVTE